MAGCATIPTTIPLLALLAYERREYDRGTGERRQYPTDAAGYPLGTQEDHCRQHAIDGNGTSSILACVCRNIAETVKVNDGRYALLKQYAQNYSSMTDEQAAGFIKRWLAFDQGNTQIRVQFIPQFEKVISPKKTTLFFQLDRRVAMMIELQLASQVPLINP